MEALIKSSFQALRREGIEPILIKGWAAARNYPENKPRFFGDIDLAVAGVDYDRAKQLTESPQSGALGVDLHRELRNLDSLAWPDLVSNSESVDIDGEPIRILCAEDHLRVLCIHWLANGGESRDRLWDIVYAVENRPADFDWNKCLSVVSPNRRGWIVSTIGLASRYLNLELTGLPFADEARNLPVWLIRCVEREWEKGIELRPLHTQLRNGKALWQQIKKRIPPNPILATVDCEGTFDNGSRVKYQIKNVVMRFLPSVKRVVPAAFTRKDDGK